MAYKCINLNSFVQSMKKFGILNIVIVLLLFCATCKNSRKEPGDGSLITIASLKGPSSMALVRFIDSINNVPGNSIRIEILDEPVQVRKMMLDGSADFALLPTTMAAILYNRGLEYRLIGIPVWGTLYLFGSEKGISDWDDLRNKRVNVMAKGMTPDVLFRYLLEKNGINPEKDLILDYSFPTHIDLANAVAAGQAELGVISEPLVSLVMKRNKDVHTIFDLNSEWNKLHGIPLAQTAFLVKESLLRTEPEQVEQIVAACERSVEWVNNNPDSGAVLIVKYNILPDYEVALNSIPRSNMNFSRIHGIKDQVNEYLSVFYKMNPDIIGGKMPDENFFY
jgi:NitT/TauT family transport system substrate-binding protein